jgi:DNA modification methylase
MAWQLYQGDALETLKQMEDESIHCCVTSPPYWGLRDYGCDGQIGLEKTPEEYVSKMVEVFREVKRVLRKDGTLWLNLGDSYYSNFGGGSGTCTTGNKEALQQRGRNILPKHDNLKSKDLVGIPWRVAFALQADGWYLRSDIIWSKGNPMPESVTDRPTKSHEYIFLLSKSKKYFYDADAIAEPVTNSTINRLSQNIEEQAGSDRIPPKRNKRTVWNINTKPYKEAHFATFPPKLPEICIKAGTSEKGCCPKCGAPWKRVIELGDIQSTGGSVNNRRNGNTNFGGSDMNCGTFTQREHITKGWKPTCSCGIEETVPCTVLDTFAGSGTTLWVAEQLGVNSIGIELNPEYCEIIRRRMDSLEPILF